MCHRCQPHQGYVVGAVLAVVPFVVVDIWLVQAGLNPFVAVAALFVVGVVGWWAWDRHRGVRWTEKPPPSSGSGGGRSVGPLGSPRPNGGRGGGSGRPRSQAYWSNRR
jgi:hypothetical protein